MNEVIFMAIQEHFTTTTAPEVLQASQAAAQQAETIALLASAPESAPDVDVMAEQSRASIFGRMRTTIGRVLYEAGVDQHKATSSYL